MERHSTLLKILLSTLTLSGLVTAEQMKASFHLVESEPPGTIVGNIASKISIARGLSKSEFKSLRYSFLNPNDDRIASLFNINPENSVVSTVEKIDREKVCEFTSECVITFDIKISSLVTSFFEIVTVQIIIDDLNDNPPKFPELEITVFIPENVNPGSTYRINGATDLDRGQNNSVQLYEMVSSANLFDLKVDKKLDGTSDLRIVVKNVIDREKKHYYRFFIVAKDGGRPPLSGNVTVNVNITDENDNSPEFTEEIYDVSVTENTPIYSVIAKIHAIDRDSDSNGKVSYRFSTLKNLDMEKLFALNPLNGDITVKNELQYQSGKQFETVVEAFDQGNPPQVGQAKLILRIIDVGNNPPIITVNPVSDVVGDMILLSEGARIGTVVAHVNIDDKDQGPNGDVLCSCSHEFFSVHKLEGRGYIVQVKKPLDRELVDELKVTVLCRDSGTPRLSARAKFPIKLTDENDNPPIFTKRVYETTLEENNVIDRPLIRVSAIDDDLGRNAIVHYRLKLDDQGMFKINTNTGEIVANDVFDRETISEMSFTVLAIDEGTPAMTGTAEVLVRIIDQNDNSPKFSPASLIFSVREDIRAGGEVGMLHASDADFNFNADIEYTMIVSGDSLPFVVFSNGVIRTDRELDFESQKRFTFKIIAKDKGTPPRNTTATVTVYVSDSNDHSPTIVFPTENNNTVTIRSDIEPGTVISRVVASDSDAGENAVLSFYINSGNKDDLFHIGTKTGEIVLAKRIRIYESTEYYLSISVQDQGTTQQASETHLTVLVDFVNSTALEMARERDLQYIIIAGVVTGVTIILSVIIVAVIIYVRRSDLQRRRGQTVCVQEHGENKNVEKQLWHSVPKDEMVAPSDKTNLDEFFKDKNCEKPDGDDSYYKNKSMDHFSGQQFFTFRKVALQVLNEDIQSDTSVETNSGDSGRGGSDSGRGGSEEDIQLPPLPETSEIEPPSFRLKSTTIESPRKNKVVTTHLLEKDTYGNRQFETYSPKMLSSYPSHSSGLPLPSPTDDSDAYIKHKRRSFHENKDPCTSKERGSKRVTFQNDLQAKQKVRNWQGSQVSIGGEPSVLPIRRGSHQSSITRLRNEFNYRLYEPRYQDDDDNTTLSGSYTLEDAIIDDDMGEHYFVSETC